MSDIPAQFTGLAAMTVPQNKDSMDLKSYSYTPRKFTEADVIVKVICCGLCGSDSGGICSAGGNTPAIFGHEIVGAVVRAGINSGHAVGDRVGFGAQQSSCHECHSCQTGHENFCPKKKFSIQSPLDSDVQPFAQGGFADYFQAEGAFAIPIPDGLDSAIAAPMLCGGATVFGPLKYSGIGKGSNVGIIGMGGLGHLGIQFAAALGANVYAFSTSNSKKEDARALGAKDVLVTSNKEELKAKYTGFFDLIISTSGAGGQPFVDLYLPLLGFRGELILVGLTPDSLEVGMYTLQAKKVSAWSTGSPSDIKEMLELAVKHGVKTWIEERPMKDLGKAVVDLLDGKARYRYVLMN